MPFESLSERLQMSFRRITGRGRVNENDINEMQQAKAISGALSLYLDFINLFRLVLYFMNDRR